MITNPRSRSNAMAKSQPQASPEPSAPAPEPGFRFSSGASEARLTGVLVKEHGLAVDYVHRMDAEAERVRREKELAGRQIEKLRATCQALQEREDEGRAEADNGRSVVFDASAWLLDKTGMQVAATVENASLSVPQDMPPVPPEVHAEAFGGHHTGMFMAPSPIVCLCGAPMEHDDKAGGMVHRLVGGGWEAAGDGCHRLKGALPQIVEGAS